MVSSEAASSNGMAPSETSRQTREHEEGQPMRLRPRHLVPGLAALAIACGGLAGGGSGQDAGAGARDTAAGGGGGTAGVGAGGTTGIGTGGAGGVGSGGSTGGAGGGGTKGGGGGGANGSGRVDASVLDSALPDSSSSPVETIEVI